MFVASCAIVKSLPDPTAKVPLSFILTVPDAVTFLNVAISKLPSATTALLAATVPSVIPSNFPYLIH